jgi:hypothetical protein
MSTTELRRRIKKQVDGLHPDRLRFASELLSLLKRHEREDSAAKRATFRSRLTKAERDVAAGRIVRVEDLKRKY